MAELKSVNKEPAISRDQLANASSLGPQRLPESQFPGASRGARQKQVCNVDAREQKHQADCAQQNEQWGPDVVDDGFL